MGSFGVGFVIFFDLSVVLASSASCGFQVEAESNLIRDRCLWRDLGIDLSGEVNNVQALTLEFKRR